MKKTFLISLGCSRNLVDSEVLLALLEKHGIRITDSPERADIAIVNTCGFIEDAKQESINTILQLVDMKLSGKIRKVIVTGCLSQRYAGAILKEIPEIDAVFGSSDFHEIPLYVSRILNGEKVRSVSKTPEFLYDHSYGRKAIGLGHSAYLKIEEGCSNRCAYCVIPDIRGPLRSRNKGSIIKEIEALKKSRKIKELILVGQDTTAFGTDTIGCSGLPDLLKDVSAHFEGGWIRLLYTHPAHFTDDLISVIKATDNICKYVDLPVQHINDIILSAMNRKTDKKRIIELISRIRGEIKGVTIRTTVMVGFPGETDEMFEELLTFLEETRFERLGAFIYSKEEGSEAAVMKGQVPRQVKEKRFDRVMELQQRISAENNVKLMGKKMRVLIDGRDDGSGEIYTGRSEMDAPDVDGLVYVAGKGKKLTVGDFIKVRVTGTMEYDLTGETI